MGTIITKNSATSGSVPASLIQGELAINVTNGRLFYGSGSGNIVKEFTGSASGGGTINTGSLLTTASFSNPNLTFTKGDGSTFNVNLVSLVPTSASFASTASFAPNYVLNSATSSFVTNAQTSSFVLNSQTSSMSVASASFASTASFAPNYVLNSATSSFVTNAQTSSMSVASASFALTASYYNETDPVFVAKSASLATTGSNTFNGSQTINGDLIVNGTASITFLNVTYESASVIYSSGSNQFGDASNDTQTLWGTVDIKSGPVLVTGSLNVSGGITGSLLGTASYANQALSSSYALTASFITASGVYGPYGSNSVISASFALTASSALNAQDILIRVLNQSGNPISKGIVVHVTASGNSSDIPRVITASYENDANSANTLGIANETIANGAEGFIMTEGILKGIDTSAFISGQLIYLGAAGSITGSAPLAPLHNVRLGQVIREQSNNGSIYVRIDNGYELGELHDVRDTTTTSSYGDLLVKSGSVWINSKQLTGSYSLTGSLTISGSSTFTNIGTTNLTGSVNITGSTTQIGNNNLFGNTTLSGSIIISGSIISPTIQVYGNVTHDGYIRFNPVSTNIDPSISASYIYVSGSTNDLYFSQNGSGYANTTRLRWLEGNLYTGLLHGGVITSQSATIYQISSGSGIIVDLNASLSDDPYPTIQYLNWSNLSASIAPFTSSYQQCFVGIDSTNNIFAQGVPFTNGQFNTIINIGDVLFQNQTSINGFKTQPSTAYGFQQSQNIFNRAFGPLKLSGYTLTPSGSSTGSLIVGSGTSYAPGANYTVDPNEPYYVSDTGTNISKIFRYHQSGSTWVYDTNAGAGYGAIDPTRYSNNGTLTAVPAPANLNWTIQRVFYFPSSVTKAIVVYYGNAYYGSEAEALANISFESFIEAPDTAANAIYLGAIVINGIGVFTNTNTFTIYPSGLFRQVGGSGGGGSTVTTTLAGLSDVNISGPIDGQALVYNNTALKWENKSFISASISGNAATSTTASFASTASYVLNAVSASFASTASFVQNAQTASYVLNAVSASFASTASYVQNAQTASYVLNAVSASFASTASYVENAQTASYVLNAISASFASTASYVLNAVSSSFASTASYVLNAVSSSFASTASFVQNAQTASYVENAQTASYVLNAVSASFAQTASFAPNYVLNSATSSFVTNSQTSSFVLNSQTSSMSVASASFASTASFVQNAQTASYVLNAVSASFAFTASYIDAGFY